VDIELVQANAADFSFPDPFDHAICICEGSLGLLGEDDDPQERDLQVLRNISASLRPGGKLLLTVLNGIKKAREASQEDVVSGKFDPYYLISYDREEVEEAGLTTELTVWEKGFAPAELVQLLKAAGFNINHIWGGTAGAWHKQVLDLDEYEIMAIAEMA